MVRRRRSELEVWQAQREAQRRLSPEERLRQNDLLTRLRIEAGRSRRAGSRG